MGYKIGVDKKQLTLVPVSLDEYVPENHICRVIKAFTDQVDVNKEGYKYAECKDRGCKPYDPRMMLSLYMYGYLHRVRSSRRLRDETRRNIEVMWLMDGLTPDDKTISNFRTNNKAALKQTFLEFVDMCRKVGLYGEEVIATDGTKIRANNSLKKHFNKVVVTNELERIDKKINDYMDTLEKGDEEDAQEAEPGTDAINAALEKLREKKARYEELQSRIVAEGEISIVDPEARLMRTGGDGRAIDVGYNVQTVVDSKYHMIVDFEVTNNSCDAGNLYTMSEKAKEVLEVATLTNLADKGYYSSEDMAACEENGVTCIVAKKNVGGTIKTKEFSHESFNYNADTDTYTCPCGNQLEFKRITKKNRGKEYRVYGNYKACVRCSRRSECTTYSNRVIWRLPHQDIAEIIDERTRLNKELYRKRQEIIEHVFGTVKSVWGYRQYLCRTKSKVTAETALAYLAYNMRRAVNIFKESGLMPEFE